jgi:hypothetical protein
MQHHIECKNVVLKNHVWNSKYCFPVKVAYEVHETYLLSLGLGVFRISKFIYFLV